MAYVVNSLPAYTEQPATLIYAKLFDEIPTLEYCQVQPGIKSAETINLVSSRVVWQAGANCNAFNPSGSSTMTQRTITVGSVKAEHKWCEADLEPKFTQKALKKGADYTSLTFNTEIIDDLLQDVRQKMETVIWQGDTNSVDAYKSRFDGFVKIINAATIGGTYSGTAWSQANSRTVMLGLAALVAADTDVWRDGTTSVKFFMNPTMVQQYKWKLINDNVGFSGAYKEGTNDTLYVEGTNIEIVSCPGLAGLNYIYAVEPENMYFGTDLAGEFEKFKVWYSQDDDDIKFRAKWKAGVQVAFPTRIYKYLGV